MAPMDQLQGQGFWVEGISLKISQGTHPSLCHPITPFTFPFSISGTPGAALLKLEPPETTSAVQIFHGSLQTLDWKPGGKAPGCAAGPGVQGRTGALKHNE